jgi:hypothetical protein
VVAGAPERSASATADLVVEMLTETLAAASSLDSEAVARELDSVHGATRMLIAGKHLTERALVLRADPLRLEITVVTGDKAASVDEKLGKVPGAASATDWTLHVPAPAPIGDWIADAVRALDHVTIDTPPAITESVLAPAVRVSDINIDALRHATGGRS